MADQSDAPAIKVDTFVAVSETGVQRLARLVTTVADEIEPGQIHHATILLDQQAVEKLIARLQEIDW